MRLTIIMPVYNEERSLRASATRSLRQHVSGITETELIIIDDGSTDATPKIISELSKLGGVRVCRHWENRGKGAAIRTGIGHSTGDLVIIQDGDLEYDPCDYPRILTPIIKGFADVVYGSRFLGSSEKRVMLFWHMVANRMLTLYSNMLTNMNLSDMETGYKAFRGSLIRSLLIEEDGFGVEPELTVKVARSNAIVHEVGITYHGRTYADGKKIACQDAVRALWVITKYGGVLPLRRKRVRASRPEILDSNPMKLDAPKP